MAQFPGPVTFHEDDPKPGFVTLFLTVEGLQISKSLGFVGKATPKNGTVSADFQPNMVQVDVSVKEKDGTETTFLYKKSLPLAIDKDRSSEEIKKGQIKLQLCKADKTESWARYSRDLTKRD